MLTSFIESLSLHGIFYSRLKMIQDSSGDGLFSVPVIDILSRYIYEKMYSKIDWKIDMEVRSRGK